MESRKCEEHNVFIGFASSSPEWCLLETLNTWNIHQPAKRMKTPNK
jgi:hypothetical protein